MIVVPSCALAFVPPVIAVVRAAVTLAMLPGAQTVVDVVALRFVLACASAPTLAFRFAVASSAAAIAAAGCAALPEATAALGSVKGAGPGLGDVGRVLSSVRPPLIAV